MSQRRFRSCTRSVLSLALLLSSTASATPTPVPALPGWLNSTLPAKGDGFQGEIKCYGLPYGGIGFTSHVLTYYTLFMLSIDRSPWTWKKNKHWKFDLTLALLALAGTSITSIFTIVRCRNRWQFVCVAVWKMSMSITLSAISTTAALRIRRKKDKKSGKAKEVSREDGLYWLILYIPGLGIGFAGLISIVLQSWDIHWLQIITIHFLSMSSAFGTLIVFIVLGLSADRYRRKKEGYFPALNVPTSTFGALKRRTSPEELFGSLKGDSQPLLPQSGNGSGAPEILADPETNLDIPMITITRDSVDITQGSPWDEASLIPTHDTESSPAIPQKPQHNSTIENLLGRNPNAKQTRWQRTFSRLGGGIEKVNVPELGALRDAALGDDSPIRRLLIILGILTSPILVTVGIFGALYSDFALGSIASNMVGSPSGDNAWLFWGYFAFKRLPMFSA